ncbi:hypothetical protein ABH917_002603 [Thermobifida halotolerans]
MSGLGEVPAVQISVREGSTRSSVRVTLSCVTSRTVTSRATWTPRLRSRSMALRPRFSPSSGIRLGAMSTRCHWMCLRSFG